MAYFTIRLELNHHDDGDYDLLHEEMEKENMLRVLKVDDVIYDMPPATYSQVSFQTTEQVFNAATSAVKRVIAKKPFNRKNEKKDYELLVTRDPDGRRFKLNVNTDKSKLPQNKAVLV